MTLPGSRVARAFSPTGYRRPSLGLQLQRVSDQKHNQWHRHALQVRSLGRDMLLCLTLPGSQVANAFSPTSYRRPSLGLQVTLPGLQVQRVSDQKHNQWHRHAVQVRSLGRDMLLCLRLKHLSAPNDPSWVPSGKGILPNQLQVTLNRSSGTGGF